MRKLLGASLASLALLASAAVAQADAVTDRTDPPPAYADPAFWVFPFIIGAGLGAIIATVAENHHHNHPAPVSP